MSMPEKTQTRSDVLPSDPFDITLANLSGHPNGASAPPAITQSVDPYGNVTQYIVQTVRWAEGDTVFVTQVNARGRDRFILPPKVLALVQRQRDLVAALVRRRHGKRLAEERKAAGIDVGAALRDPKVRARALKARKAKAAARRARREARGAK